MEILEYSKSKEELSVKFNTSAVWKYSKVDENTYRAIVQAKSPEKAIKTLFHDPRVLGTVKEEI